MLNIKWLNGNSTGKYILEMWFADGKKGYIKGDREYVNKQYNIQWQPDVVGQIIYNPQQQVLCHRYKSKAA